MIEVKLLELTQIYLARIINYLPRFLFAIIIFLVGILAIFILKKIVIRFIPNLQLKGTFKSFAENIVGVILWIILI